MKKTTYRIGPNELLMVLREYLSEKYGTDLTKGGRFTYDLREGHPPDIGCPSGVKPQINEIILEVTE